MIGAYFRRGYRKWFLGSGTDEEKTMDLSISDGVFWTIYSNMTSPYIVAFSILVIGPTAPVGYIIGIPYLVVPLAQYFAVKLSRRTVDLRSLTIKITIFDRVVWILIALLVFLRGYLLLSFLMIVLLSVRVFFSSFSGTTWNAWVPSAIGSKKRNLYFSRRNLFLRLFSLVGYGIASMIFFLLGSTKIAYVVLFVGSLIFSTLSLFIMQRIPPFKPEKEDTGGVSAAGKVLLSYLLFTLLTGIGLSAFSPYMQLYILSSSFLGQSAQIYTLVIIVIAVAAISSQLFWGKFIERVGNRKTILLSGSIISIVPLWVAYTSSIVILFFPIILLGLAQSGFTLAAFNELIRRTERRRVSGISIYNITQSLSVAVGPVFANVIFDLYRTSLLPIFVLSFSLTLIGSVYYYLHSTFAVGK
ncbi:MAG: MFS transporter [Candidatus Thermoplasmatota archaeon]|jgi:MFS family permease|nr:MFS transporter [Candidatus Thermoplasmatota archaeon]